MKARFAPQAIQDLLEIRSYVTLYSRTGAEHVRRSIIASIELIEKFPGIARDTDFEDVRVIASVRYPYLIYHRHVGKRIIILHIRHFSRDTPSRDALA